MYDFWESCVDLPKRRLRRGSEPIRSFIKQNIHWPALDLESTMISSFNKSQRFSYDLYEFPAKSIRQANTAFFIISKEQTLLFERSNIIYDNALCKLYAKLYEDIYFLLQNSSAYWFFSYNLFIGYLFFFYGFEIQYCQHIESFFFFFFFYKKWELKRSKIYL